MQRGRASTSACGRRRVFFLTQRLQRTQRTQRGRTCRKVLGERICFLTGWTESQAPCGRCGPFVFSVFFVTFVLKKIRAVSHTHLWKRAPFASLQTLR